MRRWHSLLLAACVFSGPLDGCGRATDETAGGPIHDASSGGTADVPDAADATGDVAVQGGVDGSDDGGVSGASGVGGVMGFDAATDSAGGAAGSGDAGAPDATTACVKHAALGYYDTCALRLDGTLWCWGDNRYGQLGTGAIASSQAAPTQVAPLGSDVVQVVEGYLYTCALKQNGSVWCWGWNDIGQLGTGKASGATCANSICEPSPVQVLALGVDNLELTASGSHACARKANGTVWCWGWNADGEIGNGISASAPTPPTEVMALVGNVAEVVAGWAHTCARLIDGSLWCWGYNQYGQVGDGNTSPMETAPVQVTALGAAVVGITAGDAHTCALKNDGTVWCWGQNQFGQIGDGTTVSPKASPIQVTSLGSDVKQIASNLNHTCARKANGSVWCWGLNGDGQLGDGTTASGGCFCQMLPVQVAAPGTVFTDVEAGAFHTCARTMAGELWCWGDNYDAELGTGAATTSNPCTCVTLPVVAQVPCP